MFEPLSYLIKQEFSYNIQNHPVRSLVIVCVAVAIVTLYARNVLGITSVDTFVDFYVSTVFSVIDYFLEGIFSIITFPFRFVRDFMLGFSGSFAEESKKIKVSL